MISYFYLFIIFLFSFMFTRLNNAQKHAITRCLQAKDYVMILGELFEFVSTTVTSL